MAAPVLFVQGGGEGVHDHWDDKLVASLERELGDGYAVRYPRMPRENHPEYCAWKAALREEFESLEDGAILVGHSVGGTVLIHALAEQPPRVRLRGLLLLLRLLSARMDGQGLTFGRALTLRETSADSGRCRPLIPGQAGPVFRAMSGHHPGACRHRV